MYYKIYALKNPSFAKPYIKIGLTKNVEERIKTLSGSTPEPFELVFSLDTGSTNKSLATAIENFLHTSFFYNRCDAGREFFLVDPKYVLFQLIYQLSDFCNMDYTTKEIIETLNQTSRFNLIYDEVCDAPDSDDIDEHPDASSYLEADNMYTFHRPLGNISSKNRSIVIGNRKMCFGEFVLAKSTGHSSLLENKTPPIQLKWNKKATKITNVCQHLS